jgi:hypothetical protein
MTKKHFEWAAAEVRYMRENGRPTLDLATTIEAYVKLFSKFGKRFDSGRFYEACGRG